MSACKRIKDKSRSLFSCCYRQQKNDSIDEDVMFILRMLNNITNDLDLLLSEFCELPYGEPGEPPPNRNRPMRTIGKKPMHFENCSAFGGSSTSGTLTSTDSNVSNKDVRSGTLTSTDSNNSVTKPHGFSVHSHHLDVFGLSQSRVLEPAVYPDKQQSLSRSTSGSDLRQITVLERLTKTHPIWYLPQVGRSGAVHLLKDRDIGIFIVRKSSREDTMALSVQFPGQDGTQNVDHYLIEPTEMGLHLQGSSRLFDDIPKLIAHYCDNKEDLPHRLVLPPAVRVAKTSQELTALAMLGQDFWTSSKYDVQSRSSSRSNLSEHSIAMNKSHSEPISINKNPVSAYSQSDALLPPQTPPINQSEGVLPENSPPKPTVIDFSSYLIQKPSKTLIEIGQISSHQKLTSVTENVQTKCSFATSKSTHSFLMKSENKMSENVTTTKSHLTRSSSLQEETSPKQRLVLCVNEHENRVDIQLASKRDSQVSVPYAKPNKGKFKQIEDSDHEFDTQKDLLNIPEEYYFRSNLSDKLSDYEDIWKNNYADPKVGSVQADILQRLHPNLVNGNSPRSPTSPNKFQNIFNDQFFSQSKVNTEQTSTSEKVTLSSNESTSKESVNVCYVSTAIAECSMTSTVSSATVTQCSSKHTESTVQSEILKESTHTKETDEVHVNSAKTMSVFDSILEQESDIDTDSDKEHGCHSDEDAEADTEDPEAEPTNSVQTQTSPLWKLKSPPFSKSPKKSFSAQSLSAMKSPVYSEPFDAISPEERPTDLVPKLPKKFRRRSAPALGGVSKRRLPSTECSKLSPLVPEVDSVKSVAEETKDTDSDSSSKDIEDVFELSLELNKTEENDNEDDRHLYETAWVNKVSNTNTDSPEKEKPKPSPRRNKGKKPPNLLQEAITNQRNKQEALRKSQNCANDMSMNIMDQFEFLDDFDENHNPSSPTVGKFPVFGKPVHEDLKVTYSEGSTAEDIITSCNPELTLRPVKPFPVFSALSEYDNLNNTPYIATSGLSMNSAGTTFCNPWENSVLGKIMKIQTHQNPVHVPLTAPPTDHAPPPLPSLDPRERIEAWRQSSQKYHSVHIDTEEDNRYCSDSIEAVTFGGDKNSSLDFRVSTNGPNSQSQSDKTLVNGKSLTYSETGRHCENIPLFGADFRDKVVPILAHPRLLNKSDRNRNPDRAIRDYIIGLSKDRTTTFGSTIVNFIQCTQESADSNPHNITRNVRQFMTGIKNYLVKHGEGELENLIERERNQLGKDEILNIDAIIEGSLHVCVIQPLKQDIYRLFVNEYTRNGNLKLLSSNIKYARTKTAEEIGIRKGLSPPDDSTLELIKHYFTRMQKSYSPLKKLEHLLSATSSIYKCVAVSNKGNSSPPAFGADDFLPMLIYVLIQCGMVSVEIEADYMWGLLHPSLLNGEGGYYLTSLSSAVLVLKNFREMQETSASQQEGKLPSISDMQGFLKIAIPDEQRDSIVWRTLPVRPSMTTRDVCSMIAHKFKITNPQDYGLYTLENGEEHKLMDMECPQSLKADRLLHRKDCIFAYKRNAANIAWPKSVQ
ncbi:E3 ubiquitin protein ligase rin2 [Mactra antiquata]